MHKSDVIYISKEEIIPLAEKMTGEKRRLIIINGYVDKEMKNVVVYNFDVDGHIKTYLCKGYDSLPSITPFYKGAAKWCEEEICEVMPMEFEGLEKEDRLFLHSEFDGLGQILITPLSELKKKNHKTEEE